MEGSYWYWAQQPDQLQHLESSQKDPRNASYIIQVDVFGKYGTDGRPERFKARLVARDFTQ